MGEIVLVRHGQANSSARDEAGYDRLSPLGHQQSAWLGDWMAEHGGEFDHVVSGTLRRHVETAEGMGMDADQDARLNELDYYNLTAALRAFDGTPDPGPKDFATHMPRVLNAWQAGDIQGDEPFAAFEARVEGILAEASRPGHRVLCVTSGGVIGMVLRQLLGLDLDRMAQLILPVHNSSLHRLMIHEGATYLTSFNAIPHLQSPDRAHARTFY